MTKIYISVFFIFEVPPSTWSSDLDVDFNGPIDLFLRAWIMTLFIVNRRKNGKINTTVTVN